MTRRRDVLKPPGARCDYVCRSASVVSGSVAAQETRQRSFSSPRSCAVHVVSPPSPRSTLDRRNRLDRAIAEMAADSEYTALVHRLGCLRGNPRTLSLGAPVDEPVDNWWTTRLGLGVNGPVLWMI
jgi:hypothetical protein